MDVAAATDKPWITILTVGVWGHSAKSAALLLGNVSKACPIFVHGAMQVCGYL
jgi:hypothetical protein